MKSVVSLSFNGADWSDALIVSGGALVLWGVWWLIHPAATLISAGLVLVALGLTAHFGRR